MKVVTAWSLAAIIVLGPMAAAGEIRLVSRAYPTEFADTADGASRLGGLSADGRLAVFVSAATHLVPGQVDANAGNDVFLRDRTTGLATLVSHSATAPSTTANAPSDSAVMSADGRFVAFASLASDLLPGMSVPTAAQAYLFDQATGVTILVSHAFGAAGTPTADGSAPVALSGDGRYLAYQSSAKNLVAGQSGPASGTALFLFDRLSGTSALVSHAAGAGAAAVPATAVGRCLSRDGRRLAFDSEATNLMPGQMGSGRQVYGFDSVTGVVGLVSHAVGAFATGANGPSSGAQISANGSRIAFVSNAWNLVPGFSNPTLYPASNVFSYSTVDGSLRLLSHATSSPSVGGDDDSWGPALSGDGQWVAFSTLAHTLGGVIGWSNVYLSEPDSGALSLVAGAGGDSDLAVFSADGTRIAFRSDGGGLVPGQVSPNPPDTSRAQAFVQDRASGQTVMASHSVASAATSSNGGVSALELSDDGASLAMTSRASDLGGVRDFNGADDVFAFDASSQAVSLLSRRDEARPSRSGGQGSGLPFHRYDNGSPDGPFLSDDGRFVLLSSAANNLTPQLSGRGLFLVDRFTGIPTLITHHFDDPNQGLEGTTVAEGASVSADGRYVAYLSDSGWLVAGGGLSTDCYVWDRTTNVNRRLTGNCVDVSLSADGHFVAYVFGDGVYLLDQTNATIQLVSHRAGSTAVASGGASTAPALSSDGRFVSFLSTATDLVAGGTSGAQVFLFDREAGTNVLVSHGAGAPGAGANDFSSKPSIAADGSYVAFVSLATDLVAGQADAATTEDVFLYERDTGLNRLVSHDQASPSTATGLYPWPVGRPLLSGDGRYVAFTSYGSNLVAGQQESSPGVPSSDAFLYDRVTDSTVLVSHSVSSPLLAAGSSGLGALSPDGGHVLFGSNAPDLVAGQIGAATPQAFLFDRSTGGITLMSGAGGSGSQSGNDFSQGGGLSRDATVALLASSASDLVPDDLNDAPDVFVYLSDVPPPSGRLVFHTLSPCRLTDTRLAPGEWGGPAMNAGDDRYFTVAGRCGIPASAKAVSLNLTVTQPSAPGDLRLFAGGAAPLASAINYRPGQTRANNAVVFVGPGGSIALRCDQTSGSVHVLLDVSGYFE